MIPAARFTPSLSRDEALRIYEAAVIEDETLFVYLPDLPDHLEQMRARLHDPISTDEARAFNDVVAGRRYSEDIIAWLEGEPISWDGYFVRKQFRDEEADRQSLEEFRREEEDRANGIVPPGDAPAWDFPPELRAELDANEKAAHLPSAHPCPTCGTPAEFLEWFRYSSESPFGFSCCGWKTRCRFCLQVVDDFMSAMGSTRRRLKRPLSLLFKQDDVLM